MLRLFIYSLTYRIKEGIEVNIFWISIQKIAGLWDRYGLKQGYLFYLLKHWSNCIYIYSFYIFDLLYQRGYQGKYFWTLNLQFLTYESASAWNKDSLENSKNCESNCFLSPVLLFYLMYQKVTRGEILCISWALS